MARGRQRAEWARTAKLAALLWNLHVSPQDRRSEASFNPTLSVEERREPPPPPATPEEWASLKADFCN